GIYPALVQQFSVRANADQKEKVYIGRNIAATRQAYGILSDKSGGLIEYTNYNAQVDARAAAPALRADTTTIPNARLLDPNIRNVYGFADKLDIDRYTIDGKTQDYVVGVRELVSADLTGNQQNWINRHLVYTHGNGFVAATANQDLRSQSDFVEGGIPPTGPI